MSDTKQSVPDMDDTEVEIDVDVLLADVTTQEIITAIKTALKMSDLIKPSNTLIKSCYMVLRSLYIDKKRIAIIEAPTGSGKTIIGFICHFATHHLINQKTEARYTSYFLTSNKMLQEQIDNDLDRFDFRNFIAMLKGTNNYECTFETERLQLGYVKGESFKYDFDDNKIESIYYSERACKGLTGKQKQKHYPNCLPTCPYIVARSVASDSDCAVLNYHYFLNVMRIEQSPFFNKRPLTIADEGHLIPGIVSNIFNNEFTSFLANRVIKFANELALNYGQLPGITGIQEQASLMFQWFNSELVRPSTILEYFSNVSKLANNFGALKGTLAEMSITMPYKKRMESILETITEIMMKYDDFSDLLTNRPKDLYFTSELIGTENTTNVSRYKHITKDLSESKLVADKFIKNTNKLLIMSATLGDIDEYANLMGIEENTYAKLRLPSTFDFTKSPIHICKSGWLNYKNFDANIDNVLMQCIKICNERHPKEKGIIHTGTFKIMGLLKSKIDAGLVLNPERFLFYTNAKEKQELIEKQKVSGDPLIIIGPSLYEGLDLKDDNGRFNILIKVPYAGLSEYIKKKMERYPFWYGRNTKEKIVQAIGRTNRHANDYSSVYLLDSMFDKIIYETNDDIIDRLNYLKIY